MNLDSPGDDPIAQISKAVRLHRQLAEQAKADLMTALPVLNKILSLQSGQSGKVAAILQSCWNGELCDNLASLDAKVAKAVLAMVTLRAFADPARADYKPALPVLRETLAHRSGQSTKVVAILQSVWDGELCANLSGLDSTAAQSVLAMIAARAYLSGDADSLLRPLLNRKESQQS